MYDYIIVGGGIIGTSAAWQLQKRRPDRKILIIEKEEQVACHQTGHNSGVVHAGVYYQPGSLKAKFCKQGVVETANFPFRGEYYRLTHHLNGLLRHLIYPIPDPQLPFLGVHLTRMVDGSITVGPNAVLGWKREGYGRINLDLRDTGNMVLFPGFWKVLAANSGSGLRELKNSLWKPGYLRLVQKYCPQLRLRDLLAHPAGIRAQAVLNDGTLVHDFLFAESPRSLHMCNAPSPAATSAIPIGSHICDRIRERHH